MNLLTAYQNNSTVGSQPDPGGCWTYQGYYIAPGGTLNTGPLNITVNGVASFYTVGQQIGTNDNPDVTFTGLPYQVVFRYQSCPGSTCVGTPKDLLFGGSCCLGNAPCLQLQFNQSTNCLILLPTGTNTSAILSDSLEYNIASTGWAPYIAPLCGCDIIETGNMTGLYCSVSSGNIRIGYTGFTACPTRTPDQLFIQYGNGTTQYIGGAVNSYWVQYTGAQWLALGNSAIFTLRIPTPFGYVFVKYKYQFPTGTPTGCSGSWTFISATKLYKPVQARRTVVYADGCPSPPNCLQNWTPPNNPCQNIELQGGLCNVSGGISAMCVSVFGCTGIPTYQWKKNGAILPGETNFYVNVNTYGYGLYEAIVTCGSCTNSIVLNNPNPVSCNVSVNVTNSGGTYTANVSGCSTAISYSWERWTGSAWTVVGSGSTYTPTVSGQYQVNVVCGICSANVQFTHTVSCSVIISLSQVGSTLVSSITGSCPSPTYVWRSGGPAGPIIPGATSSTYNPTTPGVYFVQVTCSNGCTDNEQITYALPCSPTLSVNINTPSGSSPWLLSSAVIGCSGTITYQWQTLTGGSTWTNILGATGSTYTSTSQSTTYRLLINCAGCPATSNVVTTPSPCVPWANINITINSTNTLLTPTITNPCPGATYIWQYSASGTGWLQVGTNLTQSITNGVGYYRFILLCPGCSPVSKDYLFTLPLCDWRIFGGCTKGVYTLLYELSVGGMVVVSATTTALAFKTLVQNWLTANGYVYSSVNTTDVFCNFSILQTNVIPDYISLSGQKFFFVGCNRVCDYCIDHSARVDKIISYLSIHNFNGDLGFVTVSGGVQLNLSNATDRLILQTMIENALTVAGSTYASVSVTATQVCVLGTNAALDNLFFDTTPEIYISATRTNCNI